MPYWISVNNRLPSSSNPVLTYSNGEYLIDIFDDGWTTNRLLDMEPTHWMELPKPPIIRESNNEKK